MLALLLDILLLFGKHGAERLFSRALAEELNGLGERGWKGLTDGKPLSGASLGKLLHPYGIVPRTIWIGESSAKGYLREEILEVARRLGPEKG